ncbi:MAG: hypothetical protein WKF75_08325 [Singulisphaera sp.]
MTPRPHARTRRAVALLALAAAGLLSLTGCDPRTLIYFLQPFEPTISAPGPSLKGKKVVVLTHAAAGAVTEFQAVDRELAKEVVSLFRKNVKKIVVVDPEKVAAWADEHPTWTDPSEVAKAFEADIVVFLEIEAFRVQNPNSPGMLEGNSRVHIQAFELATPRMTVASRTPTSPRSRTASTTITATPRSPSADPSPSRRASARPPSRASSSTSWPTKSRGTSSRTPPRTTSRT